jgi:tellurite resistance protein TerC
VAVVLGAAAIERWEWIAYVFGGGLVLAAIHAGWKDPAKREGSRMLAFLSKHMPITQERQGSKLFVRTGSGLRATPIALSLVAIELADVGFAIDSIPAAFSITRDAFVIYTANAFALLGLRALYLLLAATLRDLHYLHYGLAVVLAFAGVKLMLGEWLAIPPLASAAAIVVTIGIAVGASLWRRRRISPRKPEHDEPPRATLARERKTGLG